jgi:cytochrome c
MFVLEESGSNNTMQSDHSSGSNPGPRRVRALASVASAIFLLVASGPAIAQAVDEDAATALAKKGNCFKCHAIDKRKKAPSYKEIAAKHRGKPGAEAFLYKHINGESTVATDDGDEKHAPPPTQSRAELDNLIRWILSR